MQCLVPHSQELGFVSFDLFVLRSGYLELTFLEAESLGRRIYIYLILKETASFLSGSAKVTRQMLHLLVEKKL